MSKGAAPKRKPIAKAPAGAPEELPEPTRRAPFIRKLAEYLVGDQALMSMKLSMGEQDAKTWAELRALTPLFGYPTVAEAERTLTAWFDRGML